MVKALINLKNSFIAVLFLLSCIPFFSQSYKISHEEYKITGNTREYALQNKVKIDKNRTFSSIEDLEKYIYDVKTQIENTRVFDTVSINYELDSNQTKTQDQNEPEEIQNFIEVTEDGKALSSAKQNSDGNISAVRLFIETKDSMHLLVVPYPKYDSNNGFSLRLKAKDTNFLGSMEEMSGDFNFKMEQDDEDSPTDYVFGLNFEFDIPFNISKIAVESVNKIDVNYTIGKSTPEWNLSSGLKFELPFERFSIKFNFTQSFIRDFEYSKYDDDTYFVEDARFSVPMIIQKIDNWGNITYEPFVSGNLYWDFDGINELDNDLRSPILTIGQTLGTSRINWIENFRSGLSISLTNSYGYNFDKDQFIPGISGELKIFQSFKYFGFCSNIYAFAYMHNNENIGSRLRGIRDDVYFSKDYKDGDYAEEKACETPAAFVVSMDIPIKLFRVYWEDVPLINKIKFARYFNMEVQISPFIDFALINNRATKTDFYYKDGLYAGGLEVLVYPLKWKGIQVRGSLGIDLGRKLPYVKGKLNQDWRKQASAYEISIGIGLQY